MALNLQIVINRMMANHSSTDDSLTAAAGFDDSHERFFGMRKINFFIVLQSIEVCAFANIFALRKRELQTVQLLSVKLWCYTKNIFPGHIFFGQLLYMWCDNFTTMSFFSYRVFIRFGQMGHRTPLLIIVVRKAIGWHASLRVRSNFLTSLAKKLLSSYFICKGAKPCFSSHQKL